MRGTVTRDDYPAPSMSRPTTQNDLPTPHWRRKVAAWTASTSLFVLKGAVAAHLLISEDTGTQGAGNAELEIGLEHSREGDAQAVTLQPQLSYGALENLDLIVQPSWSALHGPESSERRFGDTGMDLKWRFLDAPPFSMAVRAGLLVPAGADGMGHAKTSAHALFVAEADLQPWTVQANLGYSTDPGVPSAHANIARVSAAVLYALNDRWTLCFDAGLDPDEDPYQLSWKNTKVVGVIYKASPALELDAGLLQGQNRASSVRQLLVGVTYRWRP
jgi:hypothetical protein